MRKLQWFVLIGSIVAVLISVGYNLFEHLNKGIASREAEFYKDEAETIRNTLIAMIEEKEKATLALAVIMQNNYDLIESFKSGIVLEERLKYIIRILNEKTHYKDIWFQLIDHNGRSLYRSWTSFKGENLIIRNDVKEMLNKPEVMSGISVGIFTFSFKAMVPIYDKNRFLGIFEVITHFNSIDRQFHKKDIHSIILVDKRFKSRLKYHYTNKFIDDYNVANFDADQQWINYIHRHGVENYINIENYRLENGHMVLSVPIKDYNNKTIGYYILIKPIANIEDASLSFFVFKFITIIIAFITATMIVIIFLLWRRSNQRKHYYKQIIDASSNIILVLNRDNNIIDVNKKFFDYFSDYRSLEEFKANHRCISDFFVKENGLLHKFMDGKHWLKFLLEHPVKEYKAKVIYKSKEWYFKVYINTINKENHYVVVLNDVTTLEKQRKELEKASLTDPLTEIGNRRYFNIKLDNEIIRSKRYSAPLSVIMLDIDHFKKVNDTYGHDVGDMVLKEVVNVVKNDLRQADIFCRVGGEEFIIILPETLVSHSYQISEKIRKLVESHLKESIPKVTISLGVAQLLDEDNKDSLLIRVDKALYEAKESGRNRSCIAKENQ